MSSLLVFDLDGTLIDSAPDIVVAMNRTLESNKRKALPEDIIVSHIGEGLKKLISDIFAEEASNPVRLKELETEFLHNYEQEMFTRTQVFPGVENFLTHYQQTGPMAIITNKNEAPARAIVEHLGLSRFPWINIFGADTLKERKPSPLPLQTMMKLANRTADSTVMIGDGIPDVLSAQRAGVPSIAIGFGYTSPHILQQYDPRGVLSHYQDLPQLLAEIRAKA